MKLGSEKCVIGQNSVLPFQVFIIDNTKAMLQSNDMELAVLELVQK
jgi:hypothetical protein